MLTRSMPPDSGTVHANSAADVPARIESLATAAGLSREAAQTQFHSAVQVVLHLSRPRSGSRLLTEVGVVQRRDGEVCVENALRFARDPDSSGPRTVEGPGLALLGRALDR